MFYQDTYPTVSVSFYVRGEHYLIDAGAGAVVIFDPGRGTLLLKGPRIDMVYDGVREVRAELYSGQ